MADWSFHNRPALATGYQSHHVFTQSNLEQSPLLQAMQRHGIADFRDFYTNGTPLPTSEVVAQNDGLARHAGSHQALRDFQTVRLAPLENTFSARVIALGNEGVPRLDAEAIAARELAPQVRGLQSVLRTGVTPLMNAAGELVDFNGNVLTADQIRAGGWLMPPLTPIPLTADISAECRCRNIIAV
jgi:hypothetical protein